MMKSPLFWKISTLLGVKATVMMSKIRFARAPADRKNWSAR